METCMFCAFMFKIYMKAQKHACFHVFSATFYCTSHYTCMVKGLLWHTYLLTNHIIIDNTVYDRVCRYSLTRMIGGIDVRPLCYQCAGRPNVSPNASNVQGGFPSLVPSLESALWSHLQTRRGLLNGVRGWKTGGEKEEGGKECTFKFLAS